MAEITPTPEAGSWVKVDSFTGPWTPQPDAGSWVKVDSFTGPWTPQPDAGSWVKVDPYTGWKPRNWTTGSVAFSKNAK